MKPATFRELVALARLEVDMLTYILVLLQNGINNTATMDDSWYVGYPGDHVAGILRGAEALIDDAETNIKLDQQTPHGHPTEWLQERLLAAVDPATKLDGKFYGAVFRHKDNTLVDPQDYVIFLARDKAFLPTLRAYWHECKDRGCAPPQLDAVSELISRVEARQAVLEQNGQMKLPDVDPGELAWKTEPSA
jgi:hypothetical protein